MILINNSEWFKGCRARGKVSSSTGVWSEECFLPRHHWCVSGPKCPHWYERASINDNKYCVWQAWTTVKRMHDYDSTLIHSLVPKISACCCSVFLLVCRSVPQVSSLASVLSWEWTHYWIQWRSVMLKSNWCLVQIKGKFLYLKKICISSFQMKLCFWRLTLRTDRWEMLHHNWLVLCNWDSDI